MTRTELAKAIGELVGTECSIDYYSASDRSVRASMLRDDVDVQLRWTDMQKLAVFLGTEQINFESNGGSRFHGWDETPPDGVVFTIVVHGIGVEIVNGPEEDAWDERCRTREAERAATKERQREANARRAEAEAIVQGRFDAEMAKR